MAKITLTKTFLVDGEGTSMRHFVGQEAKDRILMTECVASMTDANAKKMFEWLVGQTDAAEALSALLDVIGWRAGYTASQDGSRFVSAVEVQ